MFGTSTFGSAPFGGSESPSGAPGSSVTGVTIAPASATVASGGTQDFNETVTGTGAFDPTGVWSITGGASIDATGHASGATGSYTVTFTTSQGGLTATASFTVLAPGAGTPLPVVCASTIMRRSTVRLTANLTGPTYLTANLL